MRYSYIKSGALITVENDQGQEVTGNECGDNWFDAYVWMVDRQDRLSARDLADTVRIPPGGTPGYATLNFCCVLLGYDWIP